MARAVVYKRKDSFYKKAKREGYRSRASYKLIELDRTWKILRPGDLVIDLGAWPGGWIQVAAKAVGPHGHVVGIDLVRVESLPHTNVTLLQGDARDPRLQRLIREQLGRKPDVVLSDMAPKISGIRETDDAKSTELCDVALNCCHSLLKKGGLFVVKVFVNEQYSPFMRKLAGTFSGVKASRPFSTRKGSAEAYIMASDFLMNVVENDGPSESTDSHTHKSSPRSNTED